MLCNLPEKFDLEENVAFFPFDPFIYRTAHNFNQNQMKTQNKTTKKKNKGQLNYVAEQRATRKSSLDYFLDSLMTENTIDYSSKYAQEIAKYQKKSTKRNPYDF